MPPLPTIEITDDGVWCQDAPNRRWGISWDEIVRVSAGKIDAIDETWTTVELDFEFGEYISLDGGAPGFPEALQAIWQRLSGEGRAWGEIVRDLEPSTNYVLWTKPS